MIFCYIILGVIVSLWIVGIPIIIYTEKRDFNNGVCKYCNTPLRHFGDDSQGGRGFVCDNCGFTIWISWINTDKLAGNNNETD